MRRSRFASWIVGTCILSSTLLVPKQATADSIPYTLFEGFVTKVGTTAEPQWRLWNLGVAGGGPAVDFLNVTLTFNFIGGSLIYTWSNISPATFVETPPFDPSFVLTGLSVQYTLGQQVLQLSQYTTFTANSLQNSASTNAFPPPLGLFVQGTAVTVTPEPGTALLLGTGGIALFAVIRKRLRSR